MAGTKLIPSENIKALRELEAEIARSRPKLIDQQIGAETFAGELQGRIAQREVSPEARAREKETISKLFGASSEIESRFAGKAVDPTRVGNLVSGRMNSYLTQLNSIKQSRKERQDSINDIVASAAAGVKASTRRAELEFKALEDDYDRAFDQIKEITRQMERAEDRAIRYKDENVKSDIINKFNMLQSQKFNEAFNKRSGEGGTTGPFLPNINDIKLSGEEFAQLAIESKNRIGETDWLYDRISINENVKLGREDIRALQAIGFDINKPVRDQSEDEHIADINSLIADIEAGDIPQESLLSAIQALETSGIDIRDGRFSKRLKNKVTPYLSKKQINQLFNVTSSTDNSASAEDIEQEVIGG